MKNAHGMCRHPMLLALWALSLVLASCGQATRVRDDAGTRDDSGTDADLDSDRDRREDAYNHDAGPDALWPDADVNDPLEPVSYVDGSHGTDVFVLGGFAYVTDLNEGLQIADVSDTTDPRVIAEVEFEEAIAIHVEPGYAYVPISHGGDLRIFDVADPSRPREVCSHPTPGSPADVVVRGSLAFLADGYEGLRIIDVADPSSPFDLGGYVIAGEATSVDIDVVGDHAFLLGTDSLLRVIDVRDPSDPQELSTTNIPEEPAALDVEGPIAYVAAHAAGLRIIDASDPTDLRDVGVFSFPVDISDHGITRVAVRGSTAFLGVVGPWIGLIAVDVSDPARPAALGFHEVNQEIYGLFVDDDHVYITQRSRGMTIFRRRY